MQANRSILDIDSDIFNEDLSHVLDIPKVQALMEAFSTTTGLATALLDLKGNVLVATKWQEICASFHRSHPQTAQSCSESDLFLSSKVQQGEFAIYRCKNRLWDVVTPLFVGSNHLGNIFAGQFFYDDEVVRIEDFVAQANTYGFDRDEYLSALEKVPRLSREHVRNAMHFLTKITTSLAELAYSNMSQIKAICKQKALTISLQKNQSMLSSIVDSVPQGIFWKDCHGRFLGCNERFLEITGVHGIEEIVGKTDFDLPWPHEEAIAFRADDQQVILENRSKMHIIEEFHTADGSRLWLDTSKVPLLDSDGLPYGVLGVLEDITERKTVEEELARHRDNLEELVGERTEELRKMVNLMAGREVRMAELKTVIKKLRSQLDEAGIAPVANDPLLARTSK